MDFDPYLSRVREHLGASLALADDETRAVAGHVVDAAEPALQLALAQAVADALAEATMALGRAGVGAELRLASDGRSMTVLADVAEPAVLAPAAPETDDDGSTARITLRLPEAVKVKADAAAQAAGQSLNSYVVAAVRQATDAPGTIPSTRPSGHHVSGWV